MIRHADDLFATNESAIQKWRDFVTTIGECISTSKPNVASCEIISKETLNQHLKRYSVDQTLHKAFEMFFTDANPMR